MAEIVALAGIEKRRATGTVGGLFGAGKLVTKGAKGPERQYQRNAASRETGMAGGTPPPQPTARRAACPGSVA